MPSRIRSRNITYAKAGYYQTIRKSDGAPIGGPAYGYDGYSARQTMDDTTGPRPYVDHNLTGTTYRMDPLRITGETKTTGSYNAKYEGYNPANRSGWGYTPSITPVDWALLKLLAVANVNPNTPDVDLPVFLFEMREFPRMLKQLGRVLQKRTRPSDVPGGHLAWQFGWAPLISDLSALVSFAELTDNRVKFLQNLSKKGGGRVKRTIYSHDITTYTAPYIISTPYLHVPVRNTLEGTIVNTETRKAWYVARATITKPLPEGDALRLLALKTSLGWASVDAATLWNIIPWSWLIDYFLAIGTYLDAQRGYIPYKISSMCLMCKTEAQTKLSVHQCYDGLSAVGGNGSTVVKQRQVSSLPGFVVPAFRPFLTGSQKAILGSLATAKALRALRM